jgi:hypothetical protein
MSDSLSLWERGRVRGKHNESALTRASRDLSQRER